MIVVPASLLRVPVNISEISSGEPLMVESATGYDESKLSSATATVGVATTTAPDNSTADKTMAVRLGRFLCMGVVLSGMRFGFDLESGVLDADGEVLADALLKSCQQRRGGLHGDGVVDHDVGTEGGEVR